MQKLIALAFLAGCSLLAQSAVGVRVSSMSIVDDNGVEVASRPIAISQSRAQVIIVINGQPYTTYVNAGGFVSQGVVYFASSDCSGQGYLASVALGDYSFAPAPVITTPNGTQKALLYQAQDLNAEGITPQSASFGTSVCSPINKGVLFLARSKSPIDLHAIFKPPFKLQVTTY